MQKKERQEVVDVRRGPRPSAPRPREWEQLELIPTGEDRPFTPGVNYTFGAPTDYDDEGR